MRFLICLLLMVAAGFAEAGNLPVDVRYPVAAGVYYPRKPQDLKKLTRDLLEKAEGKYRFNKSETPKVVIVPHNDLFFSGNVAAAAYASLRPLKPFVKKVVLISSSHSGNYFGISLSSAKNWEIPTRSFKLDQATISRLRKIQGVDFDDAAHDAESALELQLPFIAEVFSQDVEIIPILVEDASTEQIADLIDIVWGGIETVVVVATNLSETQNIKKGVALDSETVRQIERKQDVTFKKNQLSSPLPVEGLLAYGREIRAKVKLLEMQNNVGSFIEPETVVGYASFAMYENKTGSDMGKAETEKLLHQYQEELLRIAAQSIKSGFQRGRALKVRESNYPEELQEKGATFVSLYHNGALRGNAGSNEPERSILEDIAQNAYTAAFMDFRFNPLTEDELKEAEISISLLTPKTPVKFESEDDLLAKIRPKIDGLILRERSNKALFLPQIWDAFPSRREFLSHLKRKAGLSMDYWSPTVKVYRFEVIDISSGDLENPASIWESK